MTNRSDEDYSSLLVPSAGGNHSMSGDSSRCGRWCRTIAASVCSVPIFTKYVSIRKSYMYKSIEMLKFQ